jgi:uncharacterized protein YbjT (DUF2867 family)
MILVVGATGLLGTEICRRLAVQGRHTRVFVRAGSAREALLHEMGVEIVHGDLKDGTSVQAACKGATVVVTTANSVLSKRTGDSFQTVDRDGSLALLRAAEASGVRQFVYTSVSPALPSNNDFVRYKREVESALRASPLDWTILQPSAFMEIHAGAATGWDFQGGRARLMGSGRVPISYISIADVAAFAVAAIENPAASRRELHIAGPEPLTGLDAVAVAERVTGRRFKVQRVPLAALRVLRWALRPIQPTFSALLAMGIALELGERVAMEPLLREFGVRPTTFEEYVRRLTAKAATT